MPETVVQAAIAASAVIAVCLSLFLLRIQLRDRREACHEREREKALQVSCWADWSPQEIPLLSGAVLRDPMLCVANQTNEPVFGAFVDYRDQLNGRPVRVDVGTVPPGSVRSIPISVHATDLPPSWQPEYLLPALYFRDTRNRWWHRNTVGYLMPDPGPGNDGFFDASGSWSSSRSG
jgi:hypothetical protein